MVTSESQLYSHKADKPEKIWKRDLTPGPTPSYILKHIREFLVTVYLQAHRLCLGSLLLRPWYYLQDN